MNIVVIGGHGLVGRNVVERLRAQGQEVSAASRANGVDLVSGHGLAASLAHAEVVVDVSNAPTFEGPAAFEFFRVATANLLEAEQQAGVVHHLSLSVVGTGQPGASHYLRGKALQEQSIAASGIPFSIVHATQFHEFLLDIVNWTVRDQTIRLPPAYIEPVASDDVAAVIARLASQPALQGAIDVAGPERVRMSALIERFLIDMEAPYSVQTDVETPYFGTVVDESALLPPADAERGRLGFQDWFEQSPYARAGW